MLGRRLPELVAPLVQRSMASSQASLVPRHDHVGGLRVLKSSPRRPPGYLVGGQRHPLDLDQLVEEDLTPLARIAVSRRVAQTKPLRGE